MKKLFRTKKGCMFAAAKTGSVPGGKVHRNTLLVVVGKEVKIFFRKKNKKALRERKKGFIFAPAKRGNGVWERQKKVHRHIESTA
ncbi:hypothetical protein [Flavivirga eckloniae]|uniref:hypothetical protein n=1 Tax=Flavivirga eckloniae TaxID=1803846 RepID=UPI00131585B4|nr:hypothetical protein [Flavivirga eckloniae]